MSLDLYLISDVEQLSIGINVGVNWSGPGHWDATRQLPCMVCDHPTNERTASDEPCHRNCLQGELEREFLGAVYDRLGMTRLSTSPAGGAR